jgi:hypothetical protein
LRHPRPQVPVLLEGRRVGAVRRELVGCGHGEEDVARVVPRGAVLAYLCEADAGALGQPRQLVGEHGAVGAGGC